MPAREALIDFDPSSERGVSMNVYRADKLDAFRLKSAQTEQERLQVLEDAVHKAVERAQMNYLLITLMVTVTLIVLLQSLSVVEANPVPESAYKWCILSVVLVIVLPWQLRRIRVLG
jgi:hypothetical protein